MQQQPQQQESVADWVKARCWEITEAETQIQESYGFANSVLDMETGELLEYRQLLKHPKYSHDWNILAAN